MASSLKKRTTSTPSAQLDGMNLLRVLTCTHIFALRYNANRSGNGIQLLFSPRPPIRKSGLPVSPTTVAVAREWKNPKMQEGGNFYDRVYSAERPELFFKATGPRVIGPNGPVRTRSDAKWSVPEPELTLLVNPVGAIVGYTIGNDMSSRDIEGENPLYLPQAKVYDGSCALGPGILLSSEPPAKSTAIHLEITRKEQIAFAGDTTLAELKRDPKQLVEYLFRDNTFPHGVFLMTGTGIVPGDDFTLLSGDVIRISIDQIGLLENPVV